MIYRKQAKLFLFSLSLVIMYCGCSFAEVTAPAENLPELKNVRAFNRQWRIDLYWDEGDLWRKDSQIFYEVQRADEKGGPFI